MAKKTLGSEIIVVARPAVIGHLRAKSLRGQATFEVDETSIELNGFHFHSIGIGIGIGESISIGKGKEQDYTTGQEVSRCVCLLVCQSAAALEQKMRACSRRSITSTGL